MKNFPRTSTLVLLSCILSFLTTLSTESHAQSEYGWDPLTVSDAPHLGKTVKIKIPIPDSISVENLVAIFNQVDSNMEKMDPLPIKSQYRGAKFFTLRIPNDPAYYDQEMEFNIVDVTKESTLFTINIPIGSDEPVFSPSKIDGSIELNSTGVAQEIIGKNLIGVTSVILDCECDAEILYSGDEVLDVELNAIRTRRTNYPIKLALVYKRYDFESHQLVYDTTEFGKTGLRIISDNETQLKFEKDTIVYLNQVVAGKKYELSLIPRNDNTRLRAPATKAMYIRVKNDPTIKVSGYATVNNGKCKAEISFLNEPPVNRSLVMSFQSADSASQYLFDLKISPDPAVTNVYVNNFPAGTQQTPLCTTVEVELDGNDLAPIRLETLRSDHNLLFDIEEVPIGATDRKLFLVTPKDTFIKPGPYEFHIANSYGIKRFTIDFVQKNINAELRKFLQVRTPTDTIPVTRSVFVGDKEEFDTRDFKLWFSRANHTRCEGTQVIKVKLSYYLSTSNLNPHADTTFVISVPYRRDSEDVEILSVGSWIYSTGLTLYPFSKLHMKISHAHPDLNVDENETVNEIDFTMYFTREMNVRVSLQSVIPPLQLASPFNFTNPNFETQTLNYGYGLNIDIIQTHLDIPGPSWFGGGLYLSANNLVDLTTSAATSNIEKLGMMAYFDADFKQILKARTSTKVPPVYLGAMMIPKKPVLFTIGTSIEL